jgi:hypothetical protein
MFDFFPDAGATVKGSVLSTFKRPVSELRTTSNQHLSVDASHGHFNNVEGNQYIIRSDNGEEVILVIRRLFHRAAVVGGGWPLFYCSGRCLFTCKCFIA